MIERIKASLAEAAGVLQEFSGKESSLQTLKKAAELLCEAFRKGNKVIIFGNGGSMCDAMHFAEELTARFRKDRPALPAVALSDPAFLSCAANDFGYEEAFARGVEALAKPGDVAIGISTSGQSENVIRAMQAARSRNCYTLALLGKDGGKLKGRCDLELVVAAQTTDRIQEVHIKILHILTELVETELFTS